MPTRDQVVALLEYARGEEALLIASLGPGEREALGSPNQWSAKDIVLHIAWWKDHLAHDLAAVARGERPQGPTSVDAENARVFREHEADTWEQGLAFWQEATRRLGLEVGTLSDDALSSARYLSWQEGRPLWRRILGEGCVHPLMHLAEVYMRRGDIQAATALQERSAARLGEADPSPAWQGLLSYNLACHYALCGQTAKALEQLGKGVRLDPVVLQWARQDSDLASLRAEPGYKALVPA